MFALSSSERRCELMFQGGKFRSRRANLAPQREDSDAKAATRGYYRDRGASSRGGGFARGGNAPVGAARPVQKMRQIVDAAAALLILEVLLLVCFI